VFEEAINLFAFAACISPRIGVSFGNEYWVTLSQSMQLSKADTPKAVVAAFFRKKFELYQALKAGTVLACDGEVVSVISALKTAH
jgi:hypothetical protein